MWEKLEKRDWDDALGYLAKHSPFTCPIYGNALSAGFSYKVFAMRSGFYYVYKELGEILGIVSGYNDGNVMVHTVSSHADATVLKMISDFSFHSVWGLAGKLPETAQITTVAGKAFDLRHLDVMVLSEKKENSSCPQCGFMRIDRRFLLSSYVAFIKKCLWEGFGFKSTSLDIRKRMKERGELEPYWFLTEGKEYVAQVHVQAMTPTHGYIGGVCTPRNHRKKGYAKEIVKRTCDYIMQQGRTPALAVSASNKAAYNLYKSLGFKKIGETLVYMQEREFRGDENT